MNIDYKIKIQGVSGANSAEQILWTIERVDADVAVIGDTGRSPAEKAVFDDHAQQVLLNSPVPVVYVKRE